MSARTWIFVLWLLQLLPGTTQAASPVPAPAVEKRQQHGGTYPPVIIQAGPPVWDLPGGTYPPVIVQGGSGDGGTNPPIVPPTGNPTSFPTASRPTTTVPTPRPVTTVIVSPSPPQTAGEDTKLMQETLLGISLDFPGGEYLYNPAEWESVTKEWMEAFYRQQELVNAGSTTVITDFTTELSITRQVVKTVNGVRTIRLVWKQFLSYQTYPGAAFPTYYALFPFLSFADNYDYGLQLQSSLTGWQNLQIPLGVPYITGTTTSAPTPAPTRSPTAVPTAAPTSLPTAAPTSGPTAPPTSRPTASPTSRPTASPTRNPTASPTSRPTASPTSRPTASPTRNPTASPTPNPTSTPTSRPTASPTSRPTTFPTSRPTASPTPHPTSTPTASPTPNPTRHPTATPTSRPTAAPQDVPVTQFPTWHPTTALPTTRNPTLPPTTVAPTPVPTAGPTAAPTTVRPTPNPTPGIPGTGPSIPLPTNTPTSAPTRTPTSAPTSTPTSVPTSTPTSTPTVRTFAPTTELPTAPLLVPSKPPISATEVPSDVGGGRPVTTQAPSAAPQNVDVTISGIQVTFPNAGALLDSEHEAWEQITATWFSAFYLNRSTRQLQNSRRRLQRGDDPASQVDEMSTTISITDSEVTVDPNTNTAFNTITYDQSLSYLAHSRALTPVAYVILPFEDTAANSQYAQELAGSLSQFGNLTTPIPTPIVPRVGDLSGIATDGGDGSGGVGMGGIAGLTAAGFFVVVVAALAVGSYWRPFRRRKDSDDDGDNDSDYDGRLEVTPTPQDPPPSVQGAYAMQSVEEEDFDYSKEYIMNDYSMEASRKKEIVYDYSHVYDERASELSTSPARDINVNDNVSFLSSLASPVDSPASQIGYGEGGNDRKKRRLGRLKRKSKKKGKRQGYESVQADHAGGAIVEGEEAWGTSRMADDSSIELTNTYDAGAPMASPGRVQRNGNYRMDRKSSGTSSLGSMSPSRLIDKTVSGYVGDESLVSDASSLKGDSILSNMGESNQSANITVIVIAPKGKLGVVIDTPDNGPPIVHTVKENSVIADQVKVGDKLVAVDDENVTEMTAVKVSKLISRKGANPTRKLTLRRTLNNDDP